MTFGCCSFPSPLSSTLAAQIVENRLRNFENAGTRIRDAMLERTAGVLARLCTFELIEGGRSSSFGFPSSAVDGVVDTASTTGASLDPHVLRDVSNSKSSSSSNDNSVGKDSGVDQGHESDMVDEIADPSDATIVADSIDGKKSASGGISRDSSAEGLDSPTADGGLSQGRRRLERNGDDNDLDEAKDTAMTNASTNNNNSVNVDSTAVTQVARWLQFRTADLVTFVGDALHAGDIQAASIAWRRHGRTDRGVVGATRVCGNGGGRGAEEGFRLEEALPAQLAMVPATAPPSMLGAWLRDEVLPSLDVAGAVAVRVSFLCRGGSRDSGLAMRNGDV